MNKIYLLLLSFTVLFNNIAFAENPIWKNNKNSLSYDITVYHSESCGCCKAWIRHLTEHNFKVHNVVTENVNPYKIKFHVPQNASSCHTATVNGKVIEGHVPAQDIKRLLATPNNIRLLTVPGMPSGGPGMDMNPTRKDDFAVYAITQDNKVSTFSEYIQY